MTTAGVLLDMEKFDDYVGWGELVDEAIEQEMPCNLLLISLEVYMAPRSVSKGGSVSEPVVVGRSVIAGCPRAIGMVRSFLYKACASTAKHYPRSLLREFVDDLSLLVSAERERVVKLAAEVALFMLLQLERLGCKISGKSVVVATFKKEGIAARAG